jgi:hypothetical protein
MSAFQKVLTTVVLLALASAVHRIYWFWGTVIPWTQNQNNNIEAILVGMVLPAFFVLGAIACWSIRERKSRL